MKYLKYIINIIRSYIYDFYYFLFENFDSRVLATDYKTYKAFKYYPDFQKHGNAIDNVKFLAQKYCQGKGADIGSGVWGLIGEGLEAKPIENNDENAYNIIEDDCSLDFIFSSHLLEHLDEPLKALHHWDNKLKENGILFLYLPHPASQMWNKENLKFHIWNPDPLYLEKTLINMNFSIEYITYLPDGYNSFVVVAKKKNK